MAINKQMTISANYSVWYSVDVEVEPNGVDMDMDGTRRNEYPSAIDVYPECDTFGDVLSDMQKVIKYCIMNKFFVPSVNLYALRQNLGNISYELKSVNED